MGNRHSVGPVFVLACCFLVLWGGVLSDPASAIETLSLQPGSTDAEPQWTVLSQDAGSLVLEFELGALQVEEVSAQGKTWHGLSVIGGGILGRDGEPGIPSAGRLVAVPAGAAVEARILSHSWRQLDDLRLLPVQPDDAEAFFIDESVYARTGWQDVAHAESVSGRAMVVSLSGRNGDPTPQILFGEPAIMAGQPVVPITVGALAYDAAGGRAMALERVQVELVFSGGAGLTGSRRPIPGSFDRLMSEQVSGYTPADGRNDAVNDALGTWLLIVRSSSTVLSRLEPLIEWRRRQGYHVLVRETDVIGSTTGAIKSEILAIYNDPSLPPLEFVVLAGDATGPYLVPTWNESLSGYYGEGDHYYVTLEGTDILADAHVGRLSFTSLSDLELIVDKITGYEQNPPMDDTRWFGRACLMGDPSDSGITTIYVNQWLKGQLMANGWVDVDTTWSGNFVSEMLSSVNQGVSAFGYRGYWGMSGISAGYINLLNNGDRLPVAILPTCGTGSFKSDTECRSEAFLRAPDGGAIAAVGTATPGTHTRYNNCYYNGMWEGLLNGADHRLGSAHSRAKFEMYHNYFMAEPDEAEIWAVWNNIMGDPATDMWTGVPSPLSVTHAPQLAVGAQAIPLTVEVEGVPWGGVRVCAYRAGEFQVSGITNAAGEILLAVPELTAGVVDLTVTGHGLLPYQERVTVSQSELFCGLTESQVDDGAGNGDGQLNPGETIQVTFAATNHGTTDAVGITAQLSDQSPWSSVTGDASFTFGDIAAGAQIWAAESATVEIDPAAPDGAVLQWRLQFSDGINQWSSVVEMTVAAAAFVAEPTVWGGPDIRPNPGETGTLVASLSNTGSVTAAAIEATLTSASQWVTVIQGHAVFGQAAPDELVENTATPFVIGVSPHCLVGHLAPLELTITYQGGATTTAELILPIGVVASDDPTGPDGYGYYAIDDTDVDSNIAPVYDWVALDPEHGGPGIDVGLEDFGWEQDDTRELELPFEFQYYGEVFDSISVCSNGWLAMGPTPMVHYRNFNIPSAGSPGGMIAPFWDNLYQIGSRRVYYHYDEIDHRFIVQWYNLNNTYANSLENFEVILLDPAWHPTATGDGMILFQYHSVSNTDSRDGYATVGIQNLDRSDGLVYTYWNQYNAGAAHLMDERAILFVPAGELPRPTLSVQPGALELTLEAGDETVEYLHLSNTGEENSLLQYYLQVLDPTLVPGAKEVGDEPHPENEQRNLNGSLLTLSDVEYVPGMTVDMDIEVSCSSPDQEWLIIVELDLPPGVTVNSATGISGPNGTMSWNGESGDGVTTTWGHPDSAFLRTGQTGNGSLNVTFDADLVGLQTIGWTLRGDQFGGDPHVIVGEIEIDQAGAFLAVDSPTAGAVVTIGETVPIEFQALGGPDVVDLLLQREAEGPWQVLAEGIPATAGSWLWEVDGAPGPYALIMMVDPEHANVSALSGVFAISRDISWIQVPVASGSLFYGESADLEVQISTVGMIEGAYEAAIYLVSNSGSSVVVPVNLTVGDISAAGDELPAAATLLGNWPNPFNPQTVIGFALPGDQDVKLRVYSTRGRLVRDLLSGRQAAGRHRVVWDGTDDFGHPVASGIYFYRLETSEGPFTGKMVLAK